MTVFVDSLVKSMPECKLTESDDPASARCEQRGCVCVCMLKLYCKLQIGNTERAFLV